MGGACLAGILLLGYTYAIEPLLIQREKALQQIALHDEEARKLGEQAALIARQASDPDREVRSAIADTRRESAALREKVQDLDRLLVSPQAMDRILAELLHRRPGIRVLRLVTQPGQAVTLPGADEEKKDGKDAVDGLYRHGIQLQVEGSYAELTALVEELESRAANIFRQRAVLTAGEDGKCRLSLDLFTLGLERSWLAL